MLAASANYHTGMDFQWDKVTLDLWQEMHARLGGALQQSWTYGDALQALGVRIHRVVVMQADTPVALGQFMVRRFAGYLSLASCTRGPIFDPDLPSASRRLALQQIRRTLPTRPVRVTLFGPEGSEDDVREDVQGLRKVMTGHSTVLLDLTRPRAQWRSDLEGKWRNRLVRAEATPHLRVSVDSSRAMLDWVLAREQQQRAERRFLGLPTAFVQAWVDVSPRSSRSVLLICARVKGETIAAMLFLLHGTVATYHMGWSNPTGRELNAHNLLLWQAMAELAQRGMRLLDLGGVNTHDLPGISRFKLGTGGRVLTLAGTYW
jgi:hypothetical protein